MHTLCKKMDAYCKSKSFNFASKVLLYYAASIYLIKG